MHNSPRTQGQGPEKKKGRLGQDWQMMRRMGGEVALLRPGWRAASGLRLFSRSGARVVDGRAMEEGTREEDDDGNEKMQKRPDMDMQGWGHFGLAWSGVAWCGSTGSDKDEGRLLAAGWATDRRLVRKATQTTQFSHTDQREKRGCNGSLMKPKHRSAGARRHRLADVRVLKSGPIAFGLVY